MWKMIVKTVLSSDWDFTKIKNWEMMGDAATYRRLVLGKKLLRPMLRRMRFLTPEQQEFLINHFKAESEKNEAPLTKTN
jgi:hypothetical protein